MNLNSDLINYILNPFLIKKVLVVTFIMQKAIGEILIFITFLIGVYKR